MNKGWKIAIYILLPFSTIGVIISLCVLCFRDPCVDLGFDYMGVIVGVLSLLVTVLIGWNIFYTLNFKEEVFSKIEEKHTDSLKRLKAHSILNDKDFKHIADALERSDFFCKKLDDCLLEVIKNIYKKKDN